jgi:hypothetical protein
VDIWKPHPGPQKAFCKRGEFEVLFGGAAGPGKTDCLIMEALRHIAHPRYKAVIFRRTFPKLQEIIDRCWQWYPTMGGQYRATEHRWYFPSGAAVTLAHMQRESDKYDHQGKEYHFCGFDELTQFEESQYLYLHSRVRTTTQELPMRIRATTNPGNIGHVWVKRRFVDITAPGQTYIDPLTGHSRAFIPANVYDNPSLIDNDPLYVKRLEALPEAEKRRLLYGDWDAFEGQVFTELTQQTHGCDPFEIPHEWEKIMVFDWGYGRPWCAMWLAIDYDGVIYLYRARYGMGKGEDGKPHPDKGLRQTNSEICHEIIKAERKERVSMRIADPACWGPTKIRGSNTILGPSFAEDAGNEGLFFLKADNDRLRGKQQCHQRFKMEEEADPETGEVVRESPRFVAFKYDENGDVGVKRWWEEMQSLREDEKNVEDVDTDQPDEGYDCIRYAFMSRPIMPKRHTMLSRWAVSRMSAGNLFGQRNMLGATA